MHSIADSNPRDCLSCRIIGTAALGITGLYALNQARPHAPGSPLGKRLIGVTGLGGDQHFVSLKLTLLFTSLAVLLAAAALRWNAKPRTDPIIDVIH
jgi:hypothetical protein